MSLGSGQGRRKHRQPVSMTTGHYPALPCPVFCFVSPVWFVCVKSVCNKVGVELSVFSVFDFYLVQFYLNIMFGRNCGFRTGMWSGEKK